MQLEERIEAFAKLGHFLSQFSTEKIEQKEGVLFNDIFFDGFNLLIKRAKETNGWFTEENVLFAIQNWSILLNKSNLIEFTSSYNLNVNSPKTIAIITAGNIPLVGFHDFLSVLLSGNDALVKQSSNDKYFLPFMATYLKQVTPKFKGKITFTGGKLSNFDAVIATGSDNTARYFDYYFSKYPHIIRQNRNSVAVLTGKESHKELENLGEDIFRYFGLGCRSVSKLYIPKGYNFDNFFKAIFKYKDIINYKKYSNNYDYNKAVYLMSLFKLEENGFLMLKEDKSYGSPIASLFYETYDSLDDLKNKLTNDSEKIQCIVSKNIFKNEVGFGQTQVPKLTEFADGIDTLKFLENLAI